MTDLIREAPLGQVLRFVTGNRILKYPEELPGFELPETFSNLLNQQSEKSLHSRHSSDEEDKGEDFRPPDMPALRHHITTQSVKSGDVEHNAALTRTKTRESTTPYTPDRLEVDQELAIAKTKTIPIVPQKTSDGNILVDWYTTDDAANPQNWSAGKKHFVSLILSLYTFAVYTGSAIYTPSIPGVIERFGVSETSASLPLALYVLAYGIGPLIFAPNVRNTPNRPRTRLYSLLRHLRPPLHPDPTRQQLCRPARPPLPAGILRLPCLANGGATMQDMYSLLYLPYAITVWVSAAYCGPALGPLLSGFAVTAKGWRWSLWEILWIAGPVFILMSCSCRRPPPPTSSFAAPPRLRKLTGDTHLRSQSEIDQKGLKPSKVAVDAFIKPWEITIKDPAIAFVNVYTALVYGIYYSFFEVFPLVYPVFYGFSAGIIGVVFTCILVACL